MARIKSDRPMALLPLGHSCSGPHMVGKRLLRNCLIPQAARDWSSSILSYPGFCWVAQWEWNLLCYGTGESR